MRRRAPALLVTVVLAAVALPTTVAAAAPPPAPAAAGHDHAGHDHDHGDTEGPVDLGAVDPSPVVAGLDDERLVALRDEADAVRTALALATVQLQDRRHDADVARVRSVVARLDAAGAADEAAAAEARLAELVTAAFTAGGGTSPTAQALTDLLEGGLDERADALALNAAVRRDVDEEVAALVAVRTAADTRAAEAVEALEAARVAEEEVRAEGDRLAAEARDAARRLADRVQELTAEVAVQAAQYPNGLLPDGVLCDVGGAVDGAGAPTTLDLRCDAAAGFAELAQRFTAAFGRPPCVTDSYRSYGAQVSVYARKPGLAAVPGTSNHGLGLAVDLCGPESQFGTAEHGWLLAEAGASGWELPEWASQGGSRPEPWHWEFFAGR